MGFYIYWLHFIMYVHLRIGSELNSYFSIYVLLFFIGSLTTLRKLRKFETNQNAINKYKTHNRLDVRFL